MIRRAGVRERELAEQILRHELGEDIAPPLLSDAVDRIVDRLCCRFCDLIGVDGFVAVLARAVYLSQSEASFLNAVEVTGTRKGAKLNGLLLSVRDHDGVSVRRGFVSLIANVIWLLVTFLGERLGLRIIQESWPDNPSKVKSSQSEGEQA